MNHYIKFGNRSFWLITFSVLCSLFFSTASYAKELSWNDALVFDYDRNDQVELDGFTDLINHHALGAYNSVQIEDMFNDMDSIHSGQIGDNEWSTLTITMTGSDPSTDPPVDPTSTGQPNYYFGQLHEHTDNSDGEGSVREAYSQGAYYMDFMAVTDHANQVSSSEWQETKDEAQTSITSEFVGLASFEISDTDHMNVFGTTWIADGFSRMSDTLDYISSDPNAVAQFNHPDRNGSKVFNDFKYKTEWDDHITMIEIGNTGEISSSNYKYFVEALDKGWHLAPTCGEDDHDANWGQNDYRTVILATDLSTSSLLQAMRERRVYASDDINLEIDFRINGHQMGAIVDITGTATMTLTTYDRDGENVSRIEVITSGDTVYATRSGSNEWSLELDPDNPYYFIRITQQDGEIAVTAPIWLESGGEPPISPPSIGDTYQSTGGVNTTSQNITAYTPAENGDYEIVSLGSSSCEGGDDSPIDRSLMEDQGFRLVGVEGEYDRKCEIWIRKNTGQNSVTLTGDGLDVAWNIMSLNKEDYTFDINSLTIALNDTHFDGQSSVTAPLNAPGGNNFIFAAMFFDDSVGIDDANGGDVIHSEHSFGDGDGFVTLLYPAGANLPDYVKGTCYDSGGEQMVTVAFSPKSSTDDDDGDDSDDDDGDEDTDTDEDTDDECTGPWHSANLTNYTSYPDPGSEECLEYNGCTWAGYFYGLEEQQTEEWVAAHNIVAVHKKDWGTAGMKTIRLRQGDREITATVYDLCSDSDCDGCCTQNLGGDGYLIDIEHYTMERFGSGEGIVEFQVCGSE